MPKPTRDYPLLLLNEIAKIDVKIAKLQDDRSKLVEAYAVVAREENAATPKSSVGLSGGIARVAADAGP